MLFYATINFCNFTGLDLASGDHRVGLFSLMPTSYVNILRDSGVGCFLGRFPRLGCSRRLNGFRFPNLFGCILKNLGRCAAGATRNLDDGVDQIIIDFRSPNAPHSRIMCFHVKTSSGRALKSVLLREAPKDFSPGGRGCEKGGVTICPLNGGSFLTICDRTKFCIIDCRGDLVRGIVSTHRSRRGTLDGSPIFTGTVRGGGARGFLALCKHAPSVPFLRSGDNY